MSDMTDEELQEQLRLQKYEDMGLQYKLHGTVIQKLPAVKRIWTNDLFLVSRPQSGTRLSSSRNLLNDYSEGRFIVEESPSGAYIIDENAGTYYSAPRESYAIRYTDLCASVLADTYNNVKVGSMAYEQSSDWAPKGHNHDDVYSGLSAWSSYPIRDDDEYWHLGTLTISGYSESGELKTEKIEFNCPIPKMPTFSDPDVGTLRFIAQGQLTSYQMKQYGDRYNVDIYSESFDGWVYPNGTQFTTEKSLDFAQAKDVYGTGENGFQVPDLRHFIKLNPGLKKTDALAFSKYQNGLVWHTHKINDFSCEGSIKYEGMTIKSGTGGDGSSVACGYGVAEMPIEGRINVTGSGELANAKFSGISSLYTDGSRDIESKPVHNIMPVMVFIGHAEQEA